MESICGTRILLSLPRCPTLYTPTHLFLSASASHPPSLWLAVAEATSDHKATRWQWKRWRLREPTGTMSRTGWGSWLITGFWRGSFGNGEGLQGMIQTIEGEHWLRMTYIKTIDNIERSAHNASAYFLSPSRLWSVHPLRYPLLISHDIISNSM